MPTHLSPSSTCVILGPSGAPPGPLALEGVEGRGQGDLWGLPFLLWELSKGSSQGALGLLPTGDLGHL